MRELRFFAFTEVVVYTVYTDTTYFTYASYGTYIQLIVKETIIGTGKV
jgi:hypothetical protein